MTKSEKTGSIPPLNTIFDQIRPIMVVAGEIALGYFNNPASIEREIKPDQSIVTNADKATSDYVVKQLSALTPHIPVISEESESHELRDPNGAYWVVDPIDGTAYFSDLKHQWVVMASLQYNREQIFGVIYSPIEKTFYHAAKGHGAYYIDATGVSQKISGIEWNDGEKIIPVTRADFPNDIANAPLLFLPNMGFDFDASDKSPYPNRNVTVAHGKGHISTNGYGKRGPKEWDLAHLIIVREAGGDVITTSAPYEIQFGKPDHEFFNVLTISDKRAAERIIEYLKHNPV